MERPRGKGQRAWKALDPVPDPWGWGGGAGRCTQEASKRPGKIVDLASSHLTHLLSSSRAQEVVRERDTERGNPRKQKSPGPSGVCCAVPESFLCMLPLGS